MKNKYLCLIPVLISCTLFTGCGITIGKVTIGTKDTIDAKKASVNATEKNTTPELEEDAYYVLHNGKYTPLYFGNSSFDEGEVVNEPLTTRLLWYIDDYSNNADIDSIPTLYKDDQLVYRYSDTLTEEFNFERFYDLGRSFGIYGLSETKSGRYSLSIDPDLMYPDSDVYNDISSLTSETVILEQMDTMKLRVGQGLVSDYGTICNFAFDDNENLIEADPSQEYTFLVYNGTYKNKFKFKPTYRILGSYEDYISYDFSFIEDDLIEITIPNWFESGYYLINGVGVVKYINSYSDDVTKDDLASLDLNIATNTEGLEGNLSTITNTLSGESSNVPDIYGDHSEEILNTLSLNDDGNWQISVATPGSYDIKITLSASPIEGMERETPACTLTTNSGEAFHFSYDDESTTLVLNKVYLPQGDAIFEFNDLTGITPNFEIEKSE